MTKEPYFHIGIINLVQTLKNDRVHMKKRYHASACLREASEEAAPPTEEPSPSQRPGSSKNHERTWKNLFCNTSRCLKTWCPWILDLEEAERRALEAAQQQKAFLDAAREEEVNNLRKQMQTAEEKVDKMESQASQFRERLAAAEVSLSEEAQQKRFVGGWALREVQKFEWRRCR